MSGRECLAASASLQARSGRQPLFPTSYRAAPEHAVRLYPAKSAACRVFTKLSPDASHGRIGRVPHKRRRVRDTARKLLTARSRVDRQSARVYGRVAVFATGRFAPCSVKSLRKPCRVSSLSWAGMIRRSPLWCDAPKSFLRGRRAGRMRDLRGWATSFQKPRVIYM